MSGETIGREGGAREEREKLVEKYETANKQYEDDLLNIEDMLSSGRINEEQAARFRDEVTARMEAALNPELSEDNNKQLQDDLLNIDDMLSHGTITEEQANNFTKEVKLKALEREDAKNNQEEVISKEDAEALEKRALEEKAKFEIEELEKQKLEQEAAAEVLAEAQALMKEYRELGGKILMASADELLDHPEEKQEEKPAESPEEVKEEESKEEPAEAKEKLPETPEEILAEVEKLKAELGQLEKKDPLIAINADFSADKKTLARQEAEAAINRESAGHYFKRLWKGTLFKKYYQKKYEREILSGERMIIDGEEEKSVDEVIEERSRGALDRFKLGITEDTRFIHESAGESFEEDERLTKFVKETIDEFVAEAKKSEKKLSSEDLKLQFDELFKRRCQEAADNGESYDVDVNNYGDVALQALELSIHGDAMENVMEGFKVYNAKVNDEVRTEAHRDAIDKIVDAYESNKYTQFVPPEAVALALGTVAGLAQIGARSAAGSLVPVFGGVVVSSAISGIRERNRLTEDRAHMMRDRANGLEYGEKEMARIGGAVYDQRSAAELIDDLNNADEETALHAIAEARVRIDFSDEKQKDLISYTSGSQRGNERLKLDLAVIGAENAINEEEKEKLAVMKEQIRKEIEEDIDEKDEKFANRRAILSLAKAGKTFAIGAVFAGASFVASQEIIAASDPSKIGLLEKLRGTGNNNDDAKETILANIFGGKRGTYSRVIGESAPIEVSANDTAKMQELTEKGYKATMVQDAYATTKTDLVQIDPDSSNLSWATKIDAWADNGTKIPDGNETMLYLNNGAISSGMSGTSTVNGEVIDVKQALDTNELRAFLTIGNKRFEVAGNGAGGWGKDGVFDVIGPDGTTGSIKAISDSGDPLYKYFEVAIDKGVDTDGIRHIVPLATATGPDSFSGTIDQVVETTVEHPAVYEYTKDIVESFNRGVDTSGAAIAFAPDLAHETLGEANEKEIEH